MDPTAAKLRRMARAQDRYNRLALALPSWDRSGYQRATDRATVLELDAIDLTRRIRRNQRQLVGV